MTRHLILFSYGRATSRATDNDLDRSLKDRHKREAQLFGSWLSQRGLVPDRVLSSASRPAQQSAKYACHVMGLETSAITVEKRIQADNKKVLIKLLASCPADRQTQLLVGHATLLEKVLQVLSARKIKPGKEGKVLPASSIAVLQTDAVWTQLKYAGASLLSTVRADKLPDKFPFINGDSILEWRDRPAYYYSQSAVIPYRIQQGRVEILLITSSRNKHWIIPKGVIEIGMTPEDSAAKEAYEEAGVLGRVGKVLLGSYHHRKWGAECIVQVYPLEVTEVIPQEQRLEPHRQRCWMTPDEAALCVRHKALLPMITQLTEQLMLTGGI